MHVWRNESRHITETVLEHGLVSVNREWLAFSVSFFLWYHWMMSPDFPRLLIDYWLASPVWLRAWWHHRRLMDEKFDRKTRMKWMFNQLLFNATDDNSSQKRKSKRVCYSQRNSTLRFSTLDSTNWSDYLNCLTKTVTIDRTETRDRLNKTQTEVRDWAKHFSTEATARIRQLADMRHTSSLRVVATGYLFRERGM